MVPTMDTGHGELRSVFPPVMIAMLEIFVAAVEDVLLVTEPRASAEDLGYSERVKMMLRFERLIRS